MHSRTARPQKPFQDFGLIYRDDRPDAGLVRLPDVPVDVPHCPDRSGDPVGAAKRRLHDHRKVRGRSGCWVRHCALDPDDAGGLQDSDDQPQPRPRQNVVFEMGFSVGKLGRNRVCAPKSDDVEMEIPSDYAGVVYVPFGEGRDWRLALAGELRSAGFKVNVNKLP